MLELELVLAIRKPYILPYAHFVVTSFMFVNSSAVFSLRGLGFAACPRLVRKSS